MNVSSVLVVLDPEKPKLTFYLLSAEPAPKEVAKALFNKESHSMCRTTKPTATAVSVCRLSALTNVRPGIDTRAANSCAEAT